MRKRIGEVLTEAGIISGEQLQQALMLQKGEKKRLGKMLIELGFARESQIIEALSKQLSLPIVNCSDYKVPDEVLALVPKEIAEKQLIFPLEIKNKTLLVAMSDPLDWRSIDELTFRTGLKISVAVSSESSILDAIERYFIAEKETTFDLIKEMPSYDEVEIVTGSVEEDLNVQSLYNLSGAPPIVKLVTMVLVDAVKSRASDIHIEPHEQYVQVRYRVDGDLRAVLKYPKHLQEAVISRIKIISNLDITNRRTPQDGRSTLKLEHRNIDLRISTLPSVYGENVVIRLLDHARGLVPLGNLGLPEKIMTPLIKLASQPQGMILVTGPTGSGKSTTLYALLQQLKAETEGVFTIEDPVEYKIQGITQVGVNEAAGLTFPGALRSILRQDPDIIMVGEIRDRETADIAIRSALTGHLVLSTVHTNDTISTVTRLLNIGLDAYLVASAVSGLLAQRLVRRICPECKTETDPPPSIFDSQLPPLKKYYKGLGCAACQFTGYRGQVGVYEFVQMNTKLRRLISNLANEEDLWDAAIEAGTVPLFEDAWTKVRDGLTTVDEIISKIPFREMDIRVKRTEEDQKMTILAYRVPPAVSGLLSATLEPQGYRIISSSDDDLLNIAIRENPDLIVLGKYEENLGQVKMLKQNIRYAYMPVFAIAEQPDPEKEAEGLKLGISEFMHGPIDSAKLLAMVRRELRSDN